MGVTTKIGWCDATWNPWQGCAMVSPGCANCYMFREKRMYGQDPEVVVRSKSPTFNLPLKLLGPKRVFTCSWSDWFIKDADPWRDEAWRIINQTPSLTYLILTKRIERAATRLPWGTGEPWPNVWLIVSVEDQETADRRIPQLLEINAAVRGVSYEPALGPVDFSNYLSGMPVQTSHRQEITRDMAIDAGDRSLEGQLYSDDEWEQTAPKLDWIIVGGESGPQARPFDIEWARETIAQCRAANVACFVKQLGSNPIAEPGPIRIKCSDPKGADKREWPDDILVQEFPRLRSTDE